MAGAPSPVDEKQLRELHIRLADAPAAAKKDPAKAVEPD